MLFNLLYFVNLLVGQMKPENNFSKAILSCLGQALISNPEFYIFKACLEEGNTSNLLPRFLFNLQ